MNNNKLPCIGIRQETKSKWERRVALTPDCCKFLIGNNIKIIVQPSKIRCFTDNEYMEVGCQIKECLYECNVIIGIQEVNPEELIRDITYMFFSHTIKGQVQNMPLLHQIVEKNIRLIDYECIKENIPEKGKAKRLVAFGRIAGIAGTINILKGIGEILLSRQISTPFVFTKLSFMYSNLTHAQSAVKKLGEYIMDQYLPEEICPFVIGILGCGKVSSGVRETLKFLPFREISPQELISGKLEVRRDLIYFCVFKLDDLYQAEGSKSFNKIDFMSNPEKYHSNFTEVYLPHLTAIINGLYWESRYERLISINKINKYAQEYKGRNKLIAISDIACDLKGSFEFMDEYTSFNKCFYVYDPINYKKNYKVDEADSNGILIHAIPNLAASFSLDASKLFSDTLRPFLKDLAFSKYPINYLEQNDYAQELRMACITSNGELSPPYKNLFKYAEENQRLKNIQHHNQFGKNNYQIYIKLKGDILDSGLFNKMIKTLNSEKLDFDVNYLNIGETQYLPSTGYFRIQSKEKELLFIFLKYLHSEIDKMNESCENKFEFDLINTNF